MPEKLRVGMIGRGEIAAQTAKGIAAAGSDERVVDVSEVEHRAVALPL